MFLWTKKGLQQSPLKEQITILLDKEILQWIKSKGNGYINQE